jgi:hypothetical protein
MLQLVGKAQSVMISDELSVRNDAGYVIIGKLKDKVLLFRDRVTSFEVNAYDDQMHLAWNKSLDIDNRRGSILDVVAGKESFTAIVKYKYKGHTLIKLHRYNADAKEIDTISVKDYGQRFLMPSPQSVLSEDRSKLLIYNIHNDKEIETTVVDLNTNQIIWDYTFTTAHEDLKSILKSTLIDNYGTVHFVLFDETSQNIFNNKDHQLEILEYGPEHSASTIQIVPITDRYIYDKIFRYDNVNHRVIGAGLYAEKNREKAAGYFFFSTNATHPEQYNLKFDAFDETLIAKTLGKEQSAQKGIVDVRVQDIALRKDGGVVLIIEEIRRLERMISSGMHNTAFRDGGNMHFSTDFYYEDVIALSLDADGNTQWHNVMQKRQFSQDDEGIFSSYGVFKNPSGVRLLFNDEINTETTTSEYVVTGNGKVKHNSIFNTDRQDVLLRFRDGLQVDSNEMIVPSEYRAQLKLVRIRF